MDYETSFTTDIKPCGNIYFLKPVKNSDNMYQAFASLSREFFNPQWIELNGVRRLAAEQPGTVLVVDSIDSKQFSRVRKICRKKKTNPDSVSRGFSLRIFTAYALLSINPRRLECLPLSMYPIISTCMKTLRVTTSGLGPKKFREIKRKLISMGATAQHGLLKSTSILVSTTWTAQKVMFYRNSDLELPVVTPEWVERCFERREHIKDAKAVIDKYRLPLFHGMCFCVSGFNPEMKSKICKAVQENGGIYGQGLGLPVYKFSGEKTQSRSQIDPLTSHVTTHLIVANKSGPKYECAMELREDEIHIVNYDWFLVSRKKGYPQMESDPRYTARDPEVMKELKRKELEKKQRAVLCCSLTSDNMNYSRSQNLLSSQDIPKTSPVNPIIEIEKLLTSNSISGLNLFYELSFFICGLSSVNQLSVKKLISRLGGTVYSNLVASVSHVIIGPKMTSKEALYIKRHDEKVRPVAKVDIEWIVLCVRDKKLLAESIDEASAKLLGRINSTQDLDPDEKMQINRERGESKASAMDVKLKELETSSGNRAANNNKRGLRLGDITQHAPFRITKKSHDESIPCSIPVDYVLDPPDC